jgi:hypothetical protein
MPEDSERKEIIRRAPSSPKRIKDLSEADGRVAVVGVVVSKNVEIAGFILDDGEGKVMVLANNMRDFESVSEGQFVRVLGKIWGSGEEVEIQADVVQDFSGIDKDLYMKVFFDI